MFACFSPHTLKQSLRRRLSKKGNDSSQGFRAQPGLGSYDSTHPLPAYLRTNASTRVRLLAQSSLTSTEGFGGLEERGAREKGQGILMGWRMWLKGAEILIPPVCTISCASVFGGPGAVSPFKSSRVFALQTTSSVLLVTGMSAMLATRRWVLICLNVSSLARPPHCRPLSSLKRS